ncbi:DUF4765 family protein [Vibrio vulnificus]|uniref:DUF4765 family protein n=1 Tax=Vibrio vulnificus TaxID=672 RepID=UPI00050524D3|nr:DUF4765 family protein [Vibrio vulnificus]EHY1123531.1 DUF4765 family protein [Vibrio vulnificus]KFK48146.1 hypothetical protein JS87_23240 [Vibrio vulnificus]
MLNKLFILTLPLIISNPLMASPPCEFPTEADLIAALERININTSARTIDDVIIDFLDGVENPDALKLFFEQKLGLQLNGQPLNPYLLSDFYAITKMIDIDNIDTLISRLKNISNLTNEDYLRLSIYMAKIDPEIVDSHLFQNISFYSVDNSVVERYPFLKDKPFQNTIWDYVSIKGGYDRRPEIVFNPNDVTEKDLLYAISDAINESAINSSLKRKFSDSEEFHNAWQLDVDSGAITDPNFLSEDNLELVFKELFYLVNKASPDTSWKNLFLAYEKILKKEIASSKPQSKINFHGVPNYEDLAYNKMDVENPVHKEWLEEQGFLDESGKIDQEFLNDEGNAFPNFEDTIPPSLTPPSHIEMKSLVKKSMEGNPDYQDTEVILWRGTSGDKAEAIAKNKTAGGDINNGQEVPRPSKEDANIQVSIGGHIPEYSDSLQTVDQFSKGHYAVAIRIKLKYLRPGSASEQGWVAYKNAPVKVELIVDRTNGLPESPNTGNGS